MKKRKAKPATAGEKIAKWTHTWHPAAFKSAMLDAQLARRIDAAIRRAARKERERCAKIAVCTTDPWVNKYKAIKEGAVL